MADFVHLRRVLLSPRLTKCQRDLNAAAIDFRAQQDLLVKSRALDPDYAVKVVTQRGGRIGAGEGLNPLQEPKGQGEKRTPGGEKEQLPEVRYDPKATMKPGQILKLHVTAQEMMAPGDEPNFGWVDPPQLMSQAEISEMVAKRGKRPKIIVREFDVDPRTGGPVEESRRDIEVKSLGKRIGHGGRSLIGRVARGRGLMVDDLGKFRCPPGTPNANQFTDITGSTCFKPLAIARGIIDGLASLRNWDPFLDPNEKAKWLARQSIEEQRYQAGVAAATSAVSSPLEIATEQRRLDDIIKMLKEEFDITDVSATNMEDLFALWDALVKSPAWEGSANWKRELRDMYGREVLDGYTDEEVEKMTIEEIAALHDAAMKGSVAKYAAELEGVSEEVMQARIDAGDPETLAALNQLQREAENHMRGFYEGLAILSKENPEAFKNMAAVIVQPDKYTVGARTNTLGAAADQLFDTNGDPLRPTQQVMTLNVLDAFDKYHRFRQQGTISQIIADGDQAEREKWDEIEHFLKLSHNIKPWLDHYQTYHAMEFAEAVLRSKRARGMQLAFHEFTHVEQHHIVEREILDIARRDGHVTIYPTSMTRGMEGPTTLTRFPEPGDFPPDSGLYEILKDVEFSHWTNNDWRNALSSAMMDPRTTYGKNLEGWPPPELTNFQDSMLNQLAGSYFVEMMKKYRNGIGTEEENQLLMHAITEGMAELRAQKRMGLIKGRGVDDLLEPLERSKNPIVRPPYYGLLDRIHSPSDDTPRMPEVEDPPTLPSPTGSWAHIERRIRRMHKAGKGPREEGRSDRTDINREFGWPNEAIGYVNPADLDARFDLLEEEADRLYSAYRSRGLSRDEQARLFLATRGMEQILGENARRILTGDEKDRRRKGYQLETGKYIPAGRPAFMYADLADDTEVYDGAALKALVDDIYPRMGGGMGDSLVTPRSPKVMPDRVMATRDSANLHAVAQRTIAARTNTVASQDAISSGLESSRSGSRHGSVFTSPTGLAEAIKRGAAARQYADDHVIPLADATPDAPSPHLGKEISQIIVPAMMAIDDNPLAERTLVRAMASGRPEQYAVGDQVDFSTFTSGVAVSDEESAIATDLPLGDGTSFVLEMGEGYNAAYKDHPLDDSTTGILLPPGSFRVTAINDDGDIVLTPLHQKNTEEVLGDIETVLDDMPTDWTRQEHRHIKELRNTIRTEREKAIARENFVPSGIFQYTDPDRMAYGTVRTELGALSLRDDLNPLERNRLRILTDYLKDRERPSKFMGDIDGMEVPETTYTTIAIDNHAGFASSRETRRARATKARKAMRESYDRWGGPTLDEFFDGLEDGGDPDPDKIVDEMVDGIMKGLGFRSERTDTTKLASYMENARMTLNDIGSERTELRSLMRSGDASSHNRARALELDTELNRRDDLIAGRTLDTPQKAAGFTDRVKELIEKRKIKKVVTKPLLDEMSKIEKILKKGIDPETGKALDADRKAFWEQRLQRHRESLEKVLEAIVDGRFIESLEDYNKLSDEQKKELAKRGPLVVTADQAETAMQILLDASRLHPKDSDAEALLRVKIVPTTDIKEEEIQSLLTREFYDAILDPDSDIHVKQYFDWCNVTIAGSNLFCYDNEGIMRNKMPQASGPVWNFDSPEHQKMYDDLLADAAAAAGLTDPSSDEYEEWFQSPAGWVARIEAHDEIRKNRGGKETKAARLWQSQFEEAKKRLIDGGMEPEEATEKAAFSVRFGADATRELIDQMRKDGIDVQGGFGSDDLRVDDDGNPLTTGTEGPLKRLLTKLRASQRELIGPKTMKEALKAVTPCPPPPGKLCKDPTHWLFNTVDGGASPIMVTSDGYIIDGHHRWGMLLAVAALTGEDESLIGDMNVVVVDLPINEALSYSLAFADEMGMQRAPARPGEGAPHPTTLDDPDVGAVWDRVRTEIGTPAAPEVSEGFASARTVGPPESRADVDLDEFGIYTDSTGIRMYQNSATGEWVNTEIRPTGRGGLLQQWTGETFEDLPIVENGGIRWQWDGDRWVPDPGQKDRFGHILATEGGQTSKWDPETESWVPFNPIQRDMEDVEGTHRETWSLIKKGFLVRDSRLGDPRPGASSDPRDMATPRPTDIMYHGSPAEFDEFEFGKRISGNVGAGEKNPDSGLGFHFSPFEQTAAGMGDHVKTVHIRMENPIHVEDLTSIKQVRQRALISELGLDDVYEAAFTEYLRVSKPEIFAQLRGDESIVERLLYLPRSDDERADTSGFLGAFMDELKRVTKWHEHLKEHGRAPAPWESWRDFNDNGWGVPELTGILTAEQLDDNGLLQFRGSRFEEGGVVGVEGVGTRNDEITREWLRGHGYDGIIIKDARMGRPMAKDEHQVGKILGGDPRQSSYVVLDPDQITTADPPERTPAQLAARKRMSDLIALRKEQGMSPVEEGDGANSLFVPFDVRVTVGDEVLFEGGEAEPTDKRGDAVFERIHWKNYGQPKRVRDNPELYEEGGLLEGFASQRDISTDRKTRIGQLKDVIKDYDRQCEIACGMDDPSDHWVWNPDGSFNPKPKPKPYKPQHVWEEGFRPRWPKRPGGRRWGRPSVGEKRTDADGRVWIWDGPEEYGHPGYGYGRTQGPLLRGGWRLENPSEALSPPGAAGQTPATPGSPAPPDRPAPPGSWAAAMTRSKELDRLVAERKHFQRELSALERDGLKSSRRSKSRGVRAEMQNKINARQATRNTHGVGGETGDIFEPDDGFVEELAAVENPSSGLETLLDGSNFWAWHLDTRENKTRRARESANISIAQLREGIVKDPTSVGVFEDNPLADQGLKDRTRHDIPVPKAVREFLEDHTDEEVLEKLREAAREYASGLDPRIRIGIRAHRLDALLADPQRRYKSTHEVEVGAASPPDARRLIEAQWGVPLDAPADVRPISGYAEHKEFHKARAEILAARQANPDWQRGHLQFGFTDPELLPDDPGTISPAGAALQLYGGEDGSIIVLKADRANDSAFQFGDTGNIGAGKQPARFTATDGDDLLTAIMHSAVRGDPAVPASRLPGRLEDNRGRVIALLNGVLTGDYMTAHDPAALIDLVREGGDPATLGHTTSQYIEALVPGGFDFDEIDHIRVPYGALTRNTGRHPKLAPGDVGRHDPQILKTLAPYDLSETELDKLFDNYNSIYAQHMQTYLAMLEKRREYRKHGIETVFPNDDAIDYFNPETWLSLPPTVWGNSSPDPDSNVYELLQHLIRADVIRRREEIVRNVRRPVRSFDPSMSVV